ncbi:hypothetical protein AM588_10002563 [Phytophthora nicotianae]|uniref:Ion transport domain-containing protein n=1 Tax=Phytophthora nicotianae TaxID=4792 RepID=A0A0W8CRZ1_PHYNI|nr:hypothetical protein AM588_10002563 [Phytophthora nicotianae]
MRPASPQEKSRLTPKISLPFQVRSKIIPFTKARKLAKLASVDRDMISRRFSVRSINLARSQSVAISESRSSHDGHNHDITPEEITSARNLEGEMSRFTLHHDSAYRTAWDVLVIVMILLDLVFTPLSLGFNYESKFLDCYSTLESMVYFVDFFVRMFSSFTDEHGNLISGPKQTVRNYLSSGWALPDLLSWLPFESFMRTSHSNVVGFLKIFRLAKVSHLARKLHSAKKAGIVRACHWENGSWFLTRRALAKTSNWRIMIEISSLEAALTAPELEYAHHHYDNRIHVQVEEAMTANDLRVVIAKTLSGKDEFEAEDEGTAEITATMTYHRVLLHHKQTGVELSGDMLIHELRNNIEVEIIPYHEVAAEQVGEVIETHAVVSNRIEDIRHRNTNLARLVRLQALVRGFLAKKNVEFIKIDRLVDARLVRMRNTTSTDEKPLEPSWMSLDPVLAAEYDKIQRRLEQMLRAKLHREDASEDDLRFLPQEEYDKHSADLESEHKTLPTDVQRRIQLVTERLPPMATGEYRRRQAEIKQGAKHRTTGAAKIHRAVQIEVVRKRLKRLVADNSSRKTKLVEKTITEETSIPELSVTAKSLLSSWLSPSRESGQTTTKSIGSFDPNEIDQLANAYEEGNSPVAVQRTEEKEQESPAVEMKEDKKEEEKSQPPLQLTPRMGPDDVDIASERKSYRRPGTPNFEVKTVADRGRSPRPDQEIHVISPFSKTPLISRRAAARRGTGFDNAR